MFTFDPVIHTVSEADVCPVGWLRHLDSCYSISLNQEPKEEAEITCRQTTGAGLVAIDTRDEYTYLSSQLQSALQSDSDVFQFYAMWWTSGRRHNTWGEPWCWVYPNDTGIKLTLSGLLICFSFIKNWNS